MSERPTHAKVKFFEDKFITVVPVNQIEEFKVKVPENVKDFIKDSFLYNCLWSDERNPEEISLPVQICELAVIQSEQDLQNFDNKRGTFKTLDDTIVDEYFDKQDRKNDLNSNEDVLQKKRERKVKKQKVNVANNKLQMEILQEKREKLEASDNLIIKINQPNIVVDKVKSSSPLTGSIIEENVSNKPCITNETEVEKYECLLNKFNELKNEQCIMKRKYAEVNEKLEMYKCLNEKLQFDLLVAEKQLLEQKRSLLPEKSEKRKCVTATQVSHSSQNEDTYPDISMANEIDKFECSTPKETNTNIKIDENEQKKQLPEKSETNKHAHVTGKSELQSGKNSQDLQHVFSDTECTTPKKTNVIDESQPSLIHTPVVSETPTKSISSDTEDENRCNNKVQKRLIFSDDDSDDDAENSNPLKRQKTIESNDNESNEDKTENVKTPLKQQKRNETNESEDNEIVDKQNNSVEEKSKKKVQQKSKEDEVDEAIFSNFREKVTEEYDGEKITVIYLNNEFRIPYSNWRKYYKLSACLFIKKLFREMYPYPQGIATRCVVESDKCKTPRGINKRKAISPIKMKTLERCLIYYHSERDKLKGKKLDKMVAKKNSYLTEDINKAIQLMKSSK